MMKQTTQHQSKEIYISLTLHLIRGKDTRGSITPLAAHPSLPFRDSTSFMSKETFFRAGVTFFSPQPVSFNGLVRVWISVLSMSFCSESQRFVHLFYPPMSNIPSSKPIGRNIFRFLFYVQILSIYHLLLPFCATGFATADVYLYYGQFKTSELSNGDAKSRLRYCVVYLYQQALFFGLKSNYWFKCTQQLKKSKRGHKPGWFYSRDFQ